MLIFHVYCVKTYSETDVCLACIYARYTSTYCCQMKTSWHGLIWVGFVSSLVLHFLLPGC